MALPSIGDLRSRISELSTKYLDPQISHELEPGFTPQVDDIAAFRLLSHAEIESYMEGVARERVSALRSMIQSGSLLAEYPWIYSVASAVGKNIYLDCPLDSARLKESLLGVLAAAEEVISDNNGVRSHSLMRLSVFCGFYIDQIDSTLASDLNSFGKERGEVAHASTKRVRAINSPSVEKEVVINLVTSLERHFGRLYADPVAPAA